MNKIQIVEKTGQNILLIFDTLIASKGLNKEYWSLNLLWRA